MNFVSKLTLAAMLTLGTTALATPALAQKKGEKPATGAPQLKISADFRKAATPAEAAVKAKNWAAAEPAIAASEAVAKNDDERYYAAYLRYVLEENRNNEPGQIAALSSLVGNASTPKDLVQGYRPRLEFLQGMQASKAKDNAGVIQHLTKAREYGSKQIDIPIMLANAYAATNKPAESILETRRAIDAAKASGQKAPESWYKFAIPKVNALGDRAAMTEWLTAFIRDYPTVLNWRWAISVYQQTAVKGGDPRVEKMALFRLMRATGTLADAADYLRYADNAHGVALSAEALAVIDEGRKAGKIPAGDSDAARLTAAATARVKADLSLAALAKQAAAAKDGKTAASAADVHLASGSYAAAVDLYTLALSRGGVDVDEVNLNRGIALQRAGRKEEARAAFQTVRPGPLANIASLWQTSIDVPPLT